MVALQLSNESLATLYCDKRQQGQFQLKWQSTNSLLLWNLLQCCCPGEWPQQMQFSLACNVYTPPSKARTHRTQRAHSYPNNPPIFYFLERLKKFHQDLNHSYTNLPPKNIMAQSRTLDREERALAQASQLGSNPYYHEMARFSDNNNFSTTAEQTRDTSFSLQRQSYEDDLKTCSFQHAEHSTIIEAEKV